MSVGTLGEYRRRRQRAVYLRLLQIVLFVVALCATASYAYQVGVSASQAKADKLSDELERFQQANLELRDRLAAEVREADQVEEALEALERRYAAEVPDGELRVLLAEIERQIDRGVEPDRLALLIEAAGRPSACAAAPESKRFMPVTSVGGGGVNAVRFGDGRILIQGEGESARNEQGLAEAWFDPAEPVRLTFSTLAGQTAEVAGILPLEHRMIVDDREYRFSIMAGQRAFIEVTGQTCGVLDPSAGAQEVEDQAPGEPPGVTSG